MELKKHGILSIGAFLSHTETLLVAWDETYFKRLWCTFELSAFLFANPEGRIIVAPLHLGRMVVDAMVFTWLARSFLLVQEDVGIMETRETLIADFLSMCVLGHF